jgi:hypothetical protein
VGRPILRTEEQAGDIVVKDIMCGEEAAAARSMLQISYPVRLALNSHTRALTFEYPAPSPLSPQDRQERVADDGPLAWMV